MPDESLLIWYVRIRQLREQSSRSTNDGNSRCVRRALRLGVTYEKSVTLGNVTMSHRTRERPAECLASLSHSTMIGLPRAAREN
ncbi:hypothetical protein EVAR_18876_1 [Eumeta japonica]|uniref:Uncharacterized protein n=1 Tax=Eumeta variegata TaxID=151549 RepID=A0A4C1V3V1_EUMVA|nr:hypothetical protein EVAR_18876_1 [Eumeta japonica]